MIDAIEWTRPAWLLALPAGLALAWIWWRTHSGHRLWGAHVDAKLLPHLVGESPLFSARLAFGAGTVVLALVCAALAGPLWHAQPALQPRDSGARVIVLDVSPSMDATDVAPSRLERAREAAAALLREASGAQLGLVVFGADAFTVAPLTADAGVLLHLLPGVSTTALPRPGSRPDLGLDLARSLLKRANVSTGDVIFVGDSAGDTRAVEAARALAAAGFPLSVLAVGTAQGGPVPLHTGAFARTEAGEVLLAKPDLPALERLARSGGGRFQLLAAKGEVPRFALRALASVEARAAGGLEQAPVDLGAWLALLALPFAAFFFRRGWLAGYAVIALLLPAPRAEALDWSDLWRRPDQQAATAFHGARAQDYERLGQKLGADSPWQAIVLYRSGRFAEAASHFSAHDSAVAHYNRGNALALDGDLESALAAYDAALARNPAMRDALANRALVRQALARRPPPDTEDPEPQAQGEKRARSGSSRRSNAHGNAAGEAPDSRRSGDGERMAARPAPTKPGFEDGTGEGAGTSQDPSRAAELRRLEQLLSKVDDDRGSLLANRFARQLQTRGVPPRDKGAKW
ncbi:MAG TPA: VWA domain-containing protein [Burkholderiales bacterium]|nr:VWA domain-containing protein [Burkholderiales bacterium]